MKIYFAGSIRGGREDKDLYLEIIKKLGKYGQVLTEHVGDKNLTDWGEAGPSDELIYNRDIAWVNEADVVVAEITTLSLGVGYELGYATGKKPVLCLYRPVEGRRTSAMISGSQEIRIRQYNQIDDVDILLADFFMQVEQYFFFRNKVRH